MLGFGQRLRRQYNDSRCNSSVHHYTAGESDGDSRTDGDVHGSCDGHGAARLPVAEERGERNWSHVSELHDTGNDDGGWRVDVPGGGEQHGGNGDQRGGDTDGERNSIGADDHDAARKSDSDGRTDSDVYGSCDGHGAARLPVAEERGQRNGSHGGELHDTGNNDGGQRVDIRGGGEQHGRERDQQRSHAHGEFGHRSAKCSYRLDRGGGFLFGDRPKLERIDGQRRRLQDLPGRQPDWHEHNDHVCGYGPACFDKLHVYGGGLRRRGKYFSAVG